MKKKCLILLLSLAVVFSLLPGSFVFAKAPETEVELTEENYLLIGIEYIINGLNSKGQMTAGREISFSCANLISLNASLRQKDLDDEIITFGIRTDYEGETTPLIPDEDGICRFIPTADMAGHSYFFTATIASTGEIYESNTGIGVNPNPVLSLELMTEGNGTITANRYEAQAGEEITLTITPDTGWYFDTLLSVNGSFGYRAGSDNIIYFDSGQSGPVVIKAVFKEIVQTGSCGENATYSFDPETGILTISGTGSIAEDAFNNQYKNDWDAITGVVIEEGITEIGQRAFYRNKNIETVSLPNGLTKIGNNAFWANEKLKSVNLPEGLTEIGDDGFGQCYKLSDIILPESLKVLGDSALWYTNIREITVPEGLETMKGGVFQHCEQLQTATIKAPLDTLPASTFYFCRQLKNVTLPDSMHEIGYNAFNVCDALKELKLPEAVTVLGEYAFADCSSLKNMQIPAGVTELPDGIFRKCTTLTEVTWPEHLTTIGMSAFEQCKSLPAVSIPESVQSIGSYAFRSCINLTDVHLPEELKELPSAGFQGCSKLASINIPAGIKEIPDSIFSNCALTTLTLPEDLEIIGSNAFYNNRLTGRLEIPAKIKEIPYMAFYNNSLTEVNLPENLETLGSYAFCNNQLIKIQLPDSLKTIDIYAFSNNQLKAITFPEALTSIGDLAFNNNPFTGKLTIPSTIIQIGYKAFYGSDFSEIENLSTQKLLVKELLADLSSGDGFLNSAGEEVDTIEEGTYLRKTTATSIAGADVTIPSVTYSGKALKPAPTVKLNGTTLKPNTDYEVSYENNINAGTASVTITGIGDYKDSLTKSFTINKAAQTITASNKTKTFGNAAFALGAKTNGGGKLTYKSSNTGIATISSAGKITIRKAGTVKITINAAAAANYKAASKTITLTVKKAANPLKATGKTKAYKYAAVKKKAQTLAAKYAFKISGSQGKVTYKKISGNAKITVASSGKVTVKKGLKKGTYKIKVKITAAGNSNYNKAVKTATVTIKIK